MLKLAALHARVVPTSLDFVRLVKKLFQQRSYAAELVVLTAPLQSAARSGSAQTQRFVLVHGQ
jgi:hypothetical protein